MGALNRRSIFALGGGLAAALAVPVAAAHTPASVEGPRLVVVQSDNMIPLLFPRMHTLMVEPVSGYEGRGIYMLDMGGAEVPYHCARGIGRPGIQAFSENPRYGEHWISEAQFNRVLRGRVTSATRSFN